MPSNDLVRCTVHQGPPLERLSLSLASSEEESPRDLTLHYSVDGEATMRVLGIHFVHALDDMNDRSNSTIHVTLDTVNHQKLEVTYDTSDQSGSFYASRQLIERHRL